METKTEREILEGMARALWVHAYMQWVEMPPNMSGTWDDVTPPTPDAAMAAARDLEKLIAESNAYTLAELYDLEGDDDDPTLWGRYVAATCLGGMGAERESAGRSPAIWPHFEVHIEDGELVWDGEATLERAGRDGIQRNPAVPWPRARVQSLLFPTYKFTASKAKAWARSHGYRHAHVDTTGAYHRIRQFDPDGAECRTIPFGDSGIKAIVCAAAQTNPDPPELVVLHLEDDALIQRGMARLLRKVYPGIEVITVDNVAAAKRALAEHPNLTAILSDVDVVGPENGVDFFRFVQANYPALVDRYTFLTGGHPEVADMHYRYMSKGDVDLPRLKEMMTRPAP